MWATPVILVSHQKEREGGDTSQSPLTTNIAAVLVSYAQLFPEMTAAIQRRRMHKGAQSVRGMDQTLVGFGAHARETYWSLMEHKKARRKNRHLEQEAEKKEPRHLDTRHAFYGGQFFCSLELGPGGRTQQQWLQEVRAAKDIKIPPTTLWRLKKQQDSEQPEAS
eukprot:superscaffoldBa00006890_g21999